MGEVVFHETSRRQILVSGVGAACFFEVAVQQARHLKLSGGIHNLRDAHVEAQILNRESTLKELIKCLKIRSKYAKVSIIDIIETPLTNPEANNWLTNS